MISMKLTTLLASMLLCGACATTQTASAPRRQTVEDAVATEVVSKDSDVRQCVLMEKARDQAFTTAHARVHVVAGGTVESVALDGRYELEGCIKRALQSKSLGVEPNGSAFDYDVAL